MKAYVYSANGVAIADVAKPTPKGTQVLALQLQLIEGSESMGDHDSGSDDWWCVG
jgi:hypothetical protein